MIYDYQCRNCQEVFEVWATLAQKEAGLQPQCPKCGSVATRQIIHSVNLAGGMKPSNGGSLSPPGCGPGCC